MGLYVPSPYVPLTVVSSTSSVKTPAASNNYHALTGNSVSLTAGTWRILSSALFTNNGTTPTYTLCALGIYSSNGADSGTVPTLLSATSNLTLNSTYPIYPTLGLNTLLSSLTATDIVISSQEITVTVTATVTLYVVTYSNQTTSANARITGYITAQRIY